MNYRIDLTVISEEKGTSRFGLTLHNLSEVALHNWQLNFTYEKFITPTSVKRGHLTQIGSYCSFCPEKEPLLTANSSFYFEFDVKSIPNRFFSSGITDASIQVVDSILPVDITPLALKTSHPLRYDLPKIAPSELALIPKPNNLVKSEGIFHFSAQSVLTVSSTIALSAANWLIDELSAFTQQPITQADNGRIELIDNVNLSESVYSIAITPDYILLEASSKQGFQNAAATLLQLVQSSPYQQNSGNYLLPCLDIIDQPQYNYRGMMLDCARHFHSVKQVKQLINQLAYYKFNVFHWHLTDDEGWRIEINAFPELTDVGAWRGPDLDLVPQFSHTSEIHGGFYSQKQIREVVLYAEQRGIEVIPEIDIPGHCRAAIKSLPDLLIDPDDHSVYRSIQNYTDNVLSPALDGTYQFIDHVIDEVCALFNSDYVHIGADEVPQGVWSDSIKCQQLMKEQGYQDPMELQGHLLRYVERRLQKQGKRMLGWEEVQHGDKVSKETIIYSWTSEQAGIECAKQGYDIVMQPAQYTYLDIVQGTSPEEHGVDWAGILPLEKVYHYQPMNELDADDPLRKHLLGIQCALWCEVIDHQQRIEHMLFPRLLAIAEVGWTYDQHQQWEDFLSRLQGQKTTLDRLSINYHAF
ncbi:beta-N-acetylhexosaminidase [Aliivibrio kagoshimensis]|uniref:beta-N-acetylhexosaminidase n=1 Tax=Aliivibrio kagoshimensis TaxID=2910230 RepID=UPI003D152912